MNCDFNIEFLHEFFDGLQCLLRGRANDGGDAERFGIFEGPTLFFGLFQIDVSSGDDLDTGVAEFFAAGVEFTGVSVDGKVEVLDVRKLDLRS